MNELNNLEACGNVTKFTKSKSQNDHSFKPVMNGELKYEMI